MKKNSFVLMSLLTCVALYSSAASAVITSKPTVGDHRLHLVRYSPNDVIKYVGHYGYQSAIVLEEGETVSTISMGDTISWMINPLGNRIFLKPLEQDATTNMTLITNKRIYYFVLYAEEAEDIDDPKLVFEFKFVYDDQESGNNGFIMGGTERMDPVPYPDLAENPGKYNFNY